MENINISLAGHIFTTLSFLGLGAYVSLHRRELRRTTRRSSFLFYATFIVCCVFTGINLFRVVFEITGGQESILTATLDLVAHYSSVLVQSALILLLFTYKIVAQPTGCVGRVLAIGAHPDDIEIAAGAALAKMRDAGYSISGLVLTHGEKGGHEAVRPGEAKCGAEFLGLNEVQVLDFTDAQLAKDMVGLVEAIEAMIAKVQPDIIFTHSLHDLHQDHQAVYEATMRAARATRTTILCYESPSVTQDFHPNYFVDVGKYVDVKVEAIREHWDQHNKPYLQPEQVRGKMAFRGGQAKMNYAEGFEVARMVAAV